LKEAVADMPCVVVVVGTGIVAVAAYVAVAVVAYVAVVVAVCDLDWGSEEACSFALLAG
jgi:hypothetical protein